MFLLVSQRLHYIPFEIGRLLLLAWVAVFLYLVAQQVHGDSLITNLLIRGLIAAGLVPMLALLRFFSWAEFIGGSRPAATR